MRDSGSAGYCLARVDPGQVRFERQTGISRAGRDLIALGSVEHPKYFQGVRSGMIWLSVAPRLRQFITSAASN